MDVIRICFINGLWTLCKKASFAFEKEHILLFRKTKNMLLNVYFFEKDLLFFESGYIMLMYEKIYSERLFFTDVNFSC